ncbi:hypothetical protein BDQ17DRAFT_645345 [Cyathus striatus]|nr:hypothetical protein BDQ17DRAFT_645345 [Cyathus striatus]
MAYGLVILSVLGFCYSCLESPPRCFLSSTRSVLESRNRDSKNLKLAPCSWDSWLGMPDNQTPSLKVFGSSAFCLFPVRLFGPTSTLSPKF